MSQRTSSWFVKAKRAQMADDFETWRGGGCVPTLNAFDIGDTRAVVLIVEEVEEPAAILLRMRTGRKGGGKGALLSTERSLTLATGNDQTLFVFPIDDTREVKKNQNGTGVGAENAPAYTLDRLQHPGVAVYPLDLRNALRDPDKLDAQNRQGVGVGEEGEPANTLTSAAVHGVAAYSFDSLSSNSMKSANPDSGCREVDLAKTVDTAALNPSANQGGMAVVQPVATVRRLTPVECERLQGFPDDWTAGQADSHRYKQMGNAVTVNVAEAVGLFIMAE